MVVLTDGDAEDASVVYDQHHSPYREKLAVIVLVEGSLHHTPCREVQLHTALLALSVMMVKMLLAAESDDDEDAAGVYDQREPIPIGTDGKVPPLLVLGPS